MSAPDVIQISQPGKVFGRILKLGEMVLRDGKPTLKMTSKTVPLGDGLEVLSAGKVLVSLSITAAAAMRLGWDHPANRPKYTPKDYERFRDMIYSERYGQQERLTAMRAIEEIEAADPSKGRTPRAVDLVGL